jgi:hypothetical protein
MIKVGSLDVADCARLAQEKHRLRQRDGHHTPDWDALSDLMRSELIYREIMHKLTYGDDDRVDNSKGAG